MKQQRLAPALALIALLLTGLTYVAAQDDKPAVEPTPPAVEGEEKAEESSAPEEKPADETPPAEPAIPADPAPTGEPTTDDEKPEAEMKPEDMPEGEPKPDAEGTPEGEGKPVGESTPVGQPLVKPGKRPSGIPSAIPSARPAEISEPVTMEVHDRTLEIRELLEETIAADKSLPYVGVRSVNLVGQSSYQVDFIMDRTCDNTKLQRLQKILEQSASEGESLIWGTTESLPLVNVITLLREKVDVMQSEDFEGCYVTGARFIRMKDGDVRFQPVLRLTSEGSRVRIVAEIQRVLRRFPEIRPFFAPEPALLILVGSPERSDRLMWQAMSQYHRGNHLEAERFLSLAIVEDAGNISANFFRACNNIARGRDELARRGLRAFHEFRIHQHGIDVHSSPRSYEPYRDLSRIQGYVRQTLEGMLTELDAEMVESPLYTR